jgi:hypothetical protein
VAFTLGYFQITVDHFPFGFSLPISTMAIFQLANGENKHAAPVTSMDVLIVGTGPAGAALAAFLANYGMISWHAYFGTGRVLTKPKEFVEL